MFKPRRIIWARHVELTREKRNAHRTLVGKPEGRPKCIWEDIKMVKKQDEGYGLDSSGSGYRPVAGSCEHGNEPSGSIKFWEFLE
jgi:hypothetical protein